ncbi:hypothetical protein [Streptomyces werraensis]|uniref:hypothetical protein n=1 Tax=Streptomyces werraensis TaxID=68284 RepID=UPI00367C56A4
MKYTFVCDWTDYMSTLLDDMFVVVVEAETYEEAERRAAEAALDYFPSLRDYESPKTFWGGERGAVRVAEFYGDVSANLVDRHAYDIIREGADPASKEA